MKCQQIDTDVFHVAGTAVNWYLLREGKDLTLVDAGYPGDVRAVVASIRSIGSDPGDVRAILLSHAHVDHMGAVEHFADTYGTPVYTDPVEVGHARRDHLEQATPLDVAKRAWRPDVLAWSIKITHAGATRHVSAPAAQPFPATGPLDLPGRPEPVATPGHTSGHSAFHLPRAGAVITGDGLVTGHPLSRKVGPQLLPGWFNHSTSETITALDTLAALDADCVLPGHGDPLRMPIGEAVRLAKGRDST